MNARPHSLSRQEDPVSGPLPYRRNALKLALSLCCALTFHCIPFEGLSPQAHGVLTTLLFMTLVWVTEAVSYPASAFFLIISMTLFTAFSSTGEGGVLGTRNALSAALNGFKSGAWFLVVAALSLAGAIQQTGLGQRMALLMLVRVGANPRRVRGGILAMCFILTLFIPAQAANAVLMTAVCSGLLDVLSIKRQSNFAKGLMLAVAFGCPMAGMGVLTSGAPPIQTADLIAQATGHTISWLEWMLYGMPFSLTVGLVLFVLLEWRFPVQADTLSGQGDVIRSELEKLGPANPREKRLLCVMCCTILLWATGGLLHGLDNSTIALMAVGAMFLPGISITTWEELSRTISWGTLLLFGGAISLGQSLLTTGAAAWVAENTIVRLGVAAWHPAAIVGAAAFFFALFSLAFSARAAAVAALVPTVIGFAQALPETPGLSVWGLTLISYYAIQFAVILPVNTPMSMVAYSTATFSAREMARIGFPLCLTAIMLIVAFSQTYWRWVGVL